MADDIGAYSTGKSNVAYRGWIPYCEPAIDFWELVDQAEELTRWNVNAKRGLAGAAQHQAKKRMRLVLRYSSKVITPMRQHSLSRLFSEERILCEITVRTVR